MEATGPAHPDAGGFMGAVAKIVRFRRTTGMGRNGADDGGFRKVKFPENLVEEDDQKKQLVQNREASESLLAELFAGVSAIKAAYAQLQLAESPYDPDAIQSADGDVVSELKRLSQLKRSYLKRQAHGGAGAGGGDHQHDPSGYESRLVAEVQEQRNLLKTFQITVNKLERDLRRKDAETLLLKNQLSESDMLSMRLEEKLHPHRSLHTLDGLHLSALSPAHLLAVLRYAVRSIRSFARVMEREMERAGWDLDAAAGSISPDVLCGKPEHRAFAFESYVCGAMFSGFQHHDFDLGAGAVGPSPDRRGFFDEFVEVKSANPSEILGTQNGESPFAGFCRAKYLSLVHPRMEGSFFGGLEQRTLLSSGRGFPGTEFFLGFAEMARRVWLLHRLFFSFPLEAQASVFRVGRGCRFSEVYMESVAEDADEWGADVGFTVVPGFQVGKTIIQCKVYPAMVL